MHRGSAPPLSIASCLFPNTCLISVQCRKSTLLSRPWVSSISFKLCVVDCLLCSYMEELLVNKANYYVQCWTQITYREKACAPSCTINVTIDYYLSIKFKYFIAIDLFLQEYIHRQITAKLVKFCFDPG